MNNLSLKLSFVRTGWKEEYATMEESADSLMENTNFTTNNFSIKTTRQNLAELSSKQVSALMEIDVISFTKREAKLRVMITSLDFLYSSN